MSYWKTGLGTMAGFASAPWIRLCYHITGGDPRAVRSGLDPNCWEGSRCPQRWTWQRTAASTRSTEKSNNSIKRKPPDVEQIILTNMQGKFCSWTVNFCTVLWQRIGRQLVDLIASSSTVHLLTQQWKKLPRSVRICQIYCRNKRDSFFSDPHDSSSLPSRKEIS